jgi:mono/diheme cytochrome c family protein
MYEDLGCAVCHGENADGRGRSVADLRNDDGSPARPVDLRRPWSFRGGSEPRDVVLRLVTGLAGTPMPSYLDAAKLGDLWDVAHWLRSIAVAPSLREAAIAAAKRPPGDGEELRARGEYVAKSGTCFLCHVQMQEDGAYREGSFGAGGMKVTIPTVTTVSTRNLTPDPETGIGGWTVDDFRRAVTRGTSRDGRRLGVLDMPWTIFTALDDRDVDALHTYFASLPPVRNAVPPPDAPSLEDGIAAKIAMVASGAQAKIGFHPGNTGSPEGTATAPTRPRAILIAVALFALGLLACLVALGRGRLLLLLTAASLTLAAWTYAWPPLELLPVGLVAADSEWGALARIFNFPPIRRPIAPVASDDDLRALAERGRYVATIGTCSLCHTAGPSLTRLYARFPEMGGGMRVEWKIFGTTYSRNLTPDPETGLGGWSDDEIRRAFTTGIARDGRIMHWQAMPWDHFSNLSMEDQEALVFYLRSLPPAWSKIPDRMPTSEEPADTFVFGYTGDYRP